MNKIKKSLAVFLVSVMGAIGGYSINPDKIDLSTKEKIIEQIESTEAEYYEKYQDYFSGDYSHGEYKIKIIEYETPGGSHGYQIIIDDGEKIDSVGKGKESQHRTFSKQKEKKVDNKENTSSGETL